MCFDGNGLPMFTAGWTGIRTRPKMNLPESHVLLVEDDPEMPGLLSALLHDDNVKLSAAQNCASALKLTSETKFDLILLDLGLPGANGFELLQQLTGSPRTESIPVIVL